MTSTTDQIQQLLKENQRLRKLRVNNNPLCRGCEDWRRFVASLWAGGWFGLLMFAISFAGLKRGFTPEEAYNRAFHRIEAGPVFVILAFVFTPLLVLILRWNWLLWKHNQPCLARRIQSAFTWCRARIQGKRIIRVANDKDPETPF